MQDYILLISDYFCEMYATKRLKNIYLIGIHWYFIYQWLTIIQLIQQKIDRGNKPILEMELEALPSWVPKNAKGKLALKTCLRKKRKRKKESGKGGGVLSNTKKWKNHRKTGTRRISVAIEVLLHPRWQKILLLLLKGINLEEKSASIPSAHLLHLIHRLHLFPRSLQRQEV